MTKLARASRDSILAGPGKPVQTALDGWGQGHGLAERFENRSSAWLAIRACTAQIMGRREETGIPGTNGPRCNAGKTCRTLRREKGCL